MRSTGREHSFNNPSLPGLRDHPSAQNDKVKRRNAEYNEFLRAQEEKLKHRFDEKKGHPSQPAPQVPYERQIV